jgi:hypothetical protein
MTANKLSNMDLLHGSKTGMSQNLAHLQTLDFIQKADVEEDEENTMYTDYCACARARVCVCVAEQAKEKQKAYRDRLRHTLRVFTEVSVLIL